MGRVSGTDGLEAGRALGRSRRTGPVGEENGCREDGPGMGSEGREIQIRWQEDGLDDVHHAVGGGDVGDPDRGSVHQDSR